MHKGLKVIENLHELIPDREMFDKFSNMFTFYKPEEKQEFEFKDAIKILNQGTEFDKSFSFGRKLNTLRAYADGVSKDLHLKKGVTVLYHKPKSMEAIDNLQENGLDVQMLTIPFNIQGTRIVAEPIVYNKALHRSEHAKLNIPHETRHVYQNHTNTKTYAQGVYESEIDAVEYSLKFAKRYFDNFKGLSIGQIKAFAKENCKIYQDIQFV